MIKENELKSLKGGVSKVIPGLAIGTLLSFIIGLIDGYMRPLSCHK